MKPNYAGPFPDLARPRPLECREVTARLVQLHGQPARTIDPLAEGCGGQATVLDSLVRTMLSQNTTDVTSMRAFAALKGRFPTWEAVLGAPAADVEAAIRVGGLAAIKAARMQALLATVREERGGCCLEWLRREPDAAVKAYLSRFSGVGPKTVSCVMMFCLRRDEFPVDTHVWHIAQALGWCPQGCTREAAYEHLNATVPDDVKHDLHVLLVSHGKQCAGCSKSGRGAKGCPLAELKRGRAGKATAAAAANKGAAASSAAAGRVTEEARVKVEGNGKAAAAKDSAAVLAAAVEVKAEVKVEVKAEPEDGIAAPAVAVTREPCGVAAAYQPRKRSRK